MVRSFLLNEEQRQAVEDYLRRLPDVMPPIVRQVRYKAKQLDLEQIQRELDLLRKISNFQVPMGRKSKDLKAKLSVRREEQKDLKAHFKIEGSEEKTV